MAEDVPVWRQMFDAFEKPMREYGGAVTNSPDFSEMMMNLSQNWSSLNDKTKESIAKLMHFSNIPAHSDVTKLSRQVGVLTGKVETLAARLEEMGETLDEIRQALKGKTKK